MGRPDRLNGVLEALFRADVRGLTISRAQGHGGEIEPVIRIRTGEEDVAAVTPPAPALSDALSD